MIEAAFGIAREIWRMFTDAAPYVIFGLVIAGVIQALIKQERIAGYLGKPGMKSVLVAALIGIPLPLCSCGVIPTAVSLRKSGASKGSIVSFLIATPETGIDSIAISYALLDPLMTFFRPAAALVTSLFAGFCENVFGTPETRTFKEAPACVLCSATVAHTHSMAERLRLGIRYAFTDLLCDISHWLAIGIVAGGIISYFLPSEFVTRYLGYSFWSMALMLIIGVPLYICASASTPIAAAFIAKGMSPGAALVFLLVGPATNLATILAINKFLGRKSAAVYLVSISVCAIAAGFVLNAVYLMSGIDIATRIGEAGEIIPAPLRVLSALVLLFFMVKCNLKGRCEECHL
ncbi:MAG: SO_0444 family Cu/Zn efflux transporter [Deltaproteobacteria bacterium]